MSKHTPGPWGQTRYGSHDFEIQGGGRKLAIVKGAFRNTVRAEGTERGFKEVTEEYEPGLDNAHLIAAAPELLSALRAMLTVYNTPTGFVPLREIADAVGLANAAIAKACNEGADHHTRENV